MFIDRAGIPFILIALALGALAAWGGGRAWALPFLVLAAFFVFFFRDPDRTTPTDPNLIVSPADGRVMIAGDQPATGAPKGESRARCGLILAGPIGSAQLRSRSGVADADIC
jgi:phosphatidylserine decarboxylase